jgi:hypothetical protein
MGSISCRFAAVLPILSFAGQMTAELDSRVTGNPEVIRSSSRFVSTNALPCTDFLACLPSHSCERFFLLIVGI